MTEIASTPIEAWESFYVIVGSSAGALTGLQFVVIVLAADLEALTDATTTRAFAIMGLLASDSDESSFEGTQWRHGVFTYYLLKGLMGEADNNHDRVVTANEIIRYVTTHVEDDTGDRQHPRHTAGRPKRSKSFDS